MDITITLTQDEYSKLKGYSKAVGRNIHDVAKTAIMDRVRESDKAMQSKSMTAILNLVARAFEIEPSDITGRLRLSQYAAPRHCFVWHTMKNTKHNYKEIALFLGRDRSTMYTSLQRWEDYLQTDFKFQGGQYIKERNKYVTEAIKRTL